jgi:hypothetical protein
LLHQLVVIEAPPLLEVYTDPTGMPPITTSTLAPGNAPDTEIVNGLPTSTPAGVLTVSPPMGGTVVVVEGGGGVVVGGVVVVVVGGGGVVARI